MRDDDRLHRLEEAVSTVLLAVAKGEGRLPESLVQHLKGLNAQGVSARRRERSASSSRRQRNHSSGKRLARNVSPAKHTPNSVPLSMPGGSNPKRVEDLYQAGVLKMGERRKEEVLSNREQRELQECTFTPVLSHTTRKLEKGRDTTPFWERMGGSVATGQLKAREARLTKKSEELSLKGCTHHPEIKKKKRGSDSQPSVGAECRGDSGGGGQAAHDAAVKIQAVARGRITRVRLSNAIDRLYNDAAARREKRQHKLESLYDFSFRPDLKIFRTESQHDESDARSVASRGSRASRTSSRQRGARSRPSCSPTPAVRRPSVSTPRRRATPEPPASPPSTLPSPIRGGSPYKTEDAQRKKEEPQAKKVQMEVEAAQEAQEERVKKAREAEEARKAKEEEEARKAKEAEDARKAKEADDARKAQEEEVRRKADEAAAARKAKEEEEARKAKEAEDARKAEEAEDARKAQEEEEVRKAQEEEARRKADEAAAARKAKEEEEARKVKKEEEEEARKAKEAEDARKAEEAENARKAQEEEEARKAQEAESARKAQEEAEDARRRAEEEEDARKAKEAEDARRAQEEEARRKEQEEEDARKAKEAEDAKKAQEEEAIRKQAEAQAAAERAAQETAEEERKRKDEERRQRMQEEERKERERRGLGVGRRTPTPATPTKEQEKTGDSDDEILNLMRAAVGEEKSEAGAEQLEKLEAEESTARRKISDEQSKSKRVMKADELSKKQQAVRAEAKRKKEEMLSPQPTPPSTGSNSPDITALPTTAADLFRRVGATGAPTHRAIHTHCSEYSAHYRGTVFKRETQWLSFMGMWSAESEAVVTVEEVAKVWEAVVEGADDDSSASGRSTPRDGGGRPSFIKRLFSGGSGSSRKGGDSPLGDLQKTGSFEASDPNSPPNSGRGTPTSSPQHRTFGGPRRRPTLQTTAGAPAGDPSTPTKNDPPAADAHQSRRRSYLSPNSRRRGNRSPSPSAQLSKEVVLKRIKHIYLHTEKKSEKTVELIMKEYKDAEHDLYDMLCRRHKLTFTDDDIIA